jgi:hypothetical protein
MTLIASRLRPTPPLSRAACAALALALGGCASAVSVGSFKGEEHEVAQKVADLEADTIAKHQQRVCENDLASALVARLGKARGGCQQVIKDAQAEIDPSLEVTVKSVALAGPPSARTATALVKSIYEGKSRVSTMRFVKEGGHWKISGLQ